MGAHRVALVLNDGTIIDDVVVAWGREIIQVGGRDTIEIPLDAPVAGSAAVPINLVMMAMQALAHEQ